MTPVKPQVLERLLIEADYPLPKINYLVKGFSQGFNLEYNGLLQCTDTSANIPLRIGTKLELWEKMMKEVKEKRYAGPFAEVPFKRYVQSLVGLVPKDGGTKTRLIFHLSYHFKKTGNLSMNSCIDPRKCTMKYHDIDDAVKELLCNHDRQDKESSIWQD